MIASMRIAALSAVASVALAASPVSAQFVPTGVQNDISQSTVTNTWGWTEIYRGNYGDSVNLSTVFQNAGQYVLIGATNGDSGVFDVLAATSTVDALQYTPLNMPHESNGALWYQNGYSFGFAGLGDTITQTTADTSGLNERDRLSWHTSTQAAGTYSGFGPQDASVSAVSFEEGWRAGSNVGIYTGTAWQRVVYTLSNVSSVPEPSSWAMMLLGFAGVGLTLRGQRRASKRAQIA